MSTRKSLLLFAGAALFCSLWSFGARRETRPRVETAKGERSVATSAPPAARRADALVEENRRSARVSAAAPASRRGAVQWVRALYRKEQLTRELELEQQRFGRNYWETERSERELSELREGKERLLKQLEAEANQVLNDLFPGEAGEVEKFTALFDEVHQAPNVTFLPADVRARFESELLADRSDAAFTAGRSLELAAQILSAREWDLYRQWNEPAAAALRLQLAGFAPTENEFSAILRDGGVPEEPRRADGEVGLEARLGVVRFTELQRWRDPAMSTALHDLRRLGLPMEEAAWLADTRNRAAAAMQATWQSFTLTDAAKREEVARVAQAYGQIIAARLNLPASSLEELAPAP